MTQELWSRVDEYIVTLLVPSDDALDAALVDSTQAGLPAINVAPNQGKFLSLLASIQGAENILEIGTLGGYSTIWLALDSTSWSAFASAPRSKRYPSSQLKACQRSTSYSSMPTSRAFPNTSHGR